MSPKRSIVKGRRVMRLDHRAGTMGDEEKSLKEHGRWWDIKGPEGADDPDAATAEMRRVVDGLRSQHGVRFMLDSLFVGLYEGQPPHWLGAMSPASSLLVTSSSTMDAFTKARANLIRRCIDTAASMLVKQPTEIRCLTNGASWKLQKRAKERQKFVNGLLRECGFHEIRKRTFVDGCLTRSGGLPLFWIDWQNSRISCQRVHPSHVLWNDFQGENPKELYLQYPEQRSVLVDRFPDFKKEILEAAATSRPINQAYRRMHGGEEAADLVEVTEAWHLTSSKKKPGRHIISIPTATLNPKDQEWPFDFFPIPRFCWAPSDYGWANSPIADQLVGYHIEIGKTMRKIARGQSLACSPRVWLEKGSEVDDDEVTNEIGGIGHYAQGFNPPTFSTAQAFPAEVYQYLDWLFRQAMSDIGLNEYQSQGKIPMGMEGASGKALRELTDTGSSRQVLHGQAIEEQTVMAGEIAFRLASKLAEKDKKFAVNALGARSYEKIEWDTVAGDVDDIRFVTTPASALPTNTGAKIQTVTEIIKGGLLPPEEVKGGLGLQLLNFPDFEKVITMETANRELVEMQVDGALYDGEYFAPEPYQALTGLQLLKTMAFRAYAQGLQMDDVPPRNLDLLRRLMSEADTLTQQMQGKAMEIQQPEAAVPAPAPAPLQQSPIAPPPMPAPALPPMPLPGPGGIS